MAMWKQSSRFWAVLSQIRDQVGSLEEVILIDAIPPGSLEGMWPCWHLASRCLASCPGFKPPSLGPWLWGSPRRLTEDIYRFWRARPGAELWEAGRQVSGTEELGSVKRRQWRANSLHLVWDPKKPFPRSKEGDDTQSSSYFHKPSVNPLFCVQWRTDTREVRPHELKPTKTADYKDRLTGALDITDFKITVLTMFKEIKARLRILAENWKLRRNQMKILKLENVTIGVKFSKEG